MPTSNYGFLQTEWPDIFETAHKAESLAYTDARASCFYARRGLELAVHWLYKHDAALKLPYQDNLSALIHEPTFKTTAGVAVFAKTVLINRLGNQAVHGHRTVQQLDALTAVRELFHVAYWLAHTYERGAKPAPGLAFDPNALPKTTPLPKQTIEQLQRLETELRERDEKLSSLLADKTALDAELTRLRVEVAEAKKANTSQADTHDYSEAETRDYFIDLLLKEAGWALNQERDREFPVEGMPNNEGKGFVDYVLWGDDGLPLALNEAKRTKRDPRVGQRQPAASGLTWKTGESNGHELLRLHKQEREAAAHGSVGAGGKRQHDALRRVNVGDYNPKVGLNGSRLELDRSPPHSPLARGLIIQHQMWR